MVQEELLTKELPYEKFLTLGPGALTEAELIAIILRTGTRNCSALELAKKVLAKASGKSKGLNGLHHLSLQELMEIPGIGEVKAVKIKCMAEMAIRMATQKAAESLKYDTPETIADYYMEQMRHLEKEKVILLLLDNKLHLIEEYMLSLGTGNASLLSTRDVFIEALRVRACKMILLHNHPSGDPFPSREDLGITQTMKEAGEMMDIPLIDHIILGDGCFISLKKEEFL